jgi:hypothetical protein
MAATSMPSALTATVIGGALYERRFKRKRPTTRRVIHRYDCRGRTLQWCTQRRVKVTVKNPWLKKNPLLSLWLSGANSVAGSIRSRATSEAHRQTARMIADGQRQMLAFWTGGNVGVKKKRRKSR